MRIVGGIGVPHTPQFPVWHAQGAPIAADLDRLYGELARHLDEMAPDVVVYFTTDHYNLFFESVPIFSIGVAESTRGPRDHPALEQYDLRIDGALADRIQEHVVRAGFDVGKTHEFEVDHAITVPWHFMRPQVDVPIVPIFVSALIPPLPSAERCYALGRAVREAVERAPGDERVVAMGTGSFSLDIGGPRMSASSHVGVPAPAWVDEILRLMRAGDVAELVRRATPQQLAEAGSAGGEVLDWIAMLGMLDPAPAVFLEAQMELGHAYGVWRQDAREDEMGVYAVDKLCYRLMYEPDLREALTRAPEETLRAIRPPLTDEQIEALLAGDVGRLSKMGANHFLLHNLGRLELLGLDLTTYADRIRAAYR